MNSQALHPEPGFDRDRELDEQRHRAVRQQQLLQQEEMAHREQREAAERAAAAAAQQLREPPAPPPYQSAGGAPPPHHSSAGSLTLHQPVASRLPGAIHSPGGLLASHGVSATGVALGVPAGPPVSFGGPLQPQQQQQAGPPPGQGAQQGQTPQHDAAGRMPSQQNGPPPPQQQHGGQSLQGVAPPQPPQVFAPMTVHNAGAGAPPPPPPPNGGMGPSSGPSPGNGFGGPLQPDAGRAVQQMPFAGGGGGGGGPIQGPGHGAPPSGGPAGMPQGQQPILNDALSYLDQVKVQFADQADVYNRFLDIMKDFKSQTIDTPGVINRVSELFAGHPNLIQGFNTFLPPGYRIECGAGNDPNTIRVTTPMGTTVQSIAGRGSQSDGIPPPPGPNQYYNQRTGSWQQQPQHSIESPEAAFSTPAQNGPGIFGQSATLGPGPSAGFDGQGAPLQRGVGQMAGNSAAGHAPPRSAHTPTPGAQPGTVNGAGSAQQGANMEKRGPVEFNHAISYVNKIKNRFQDKPEIYKQFLEILQTYQREQKPIQDVYAQVTTLFHTAPDLLEDFKQFLPESAAHGKPAAGRPSEEMTPTGANQTAPPGHARDSQKLPPVGSFAPPSASKEGKKRPRTDKIPPAPVVAPPEPAAAALRSISGVATGSNKRQKVVQKPLAADIPTIEPTLTPVHPEPLPPSARTLATTDEIALFERIRKHLGNKTVFNEFLKLLNLFNQQLIDRGMLVYKAGQFIQSNPELMASFKTLVAYKADDEAVENRPEPPAEKVSLSNCRGYGPSYRLLPKRERLKPCSGRDDLCRSVLNDEWASHPTWASEDSGFVAHRKNAFEEGLHRIEEERHDYDFHIEANQKCIQLLEPIAQQMLALSAAEREHFAMPAGLGGQSTSIYKRVLKKIYGNDKGAQVVNDMFHEPFAVVPVVLARLKQRDEDWRFTQREWQKIWQSNTETMHLKSLDHMGIMVKQTDKRNLSAKHLVDLIKTKYEEQRRIRIGSGKAPRHQLTFDFSDKDLLIDLLRFMLIYAYNNGQHSASEKERIVDFFETFVPQFFGLPEEVVQARIHDIERESAEDEADDPVPAELTNGRSRRSGKKSDLLRGVLDPGRNGSKHHRKEKEESAASGSKETTPDVGSANEEEEMPDATEEAVPADAVNDRWLPTVPRPTVVSGENPLLDSDGELKADGAFRRPWYNFFCNQTIYVFFSIFHALYQRLQDVKGSDELVDTEIRRMKTRKPAHELGYSTVEENFFESSRPGEYWGRTLELVEDYLNGEVDENRYQDVLRRYYLKNGWKLYTIQDLLKTLCRLSLTCTSTDSKEKTPDLIQQFLNQRHQEETSYQNEIGMRKFAEKCIKDGDMFVISWFPNKDEATVRWLQRDETTFYMDEMELKERWQYYISSFMRVEPTEGINRARLQRAVLARNLPSTDADSEDGSTPKPLAYSEGLVLRICLNSTKIVWENGTSEFFIYSTIPDSEEERAKRKDKLLANRERRDQKFREKLIMNNAWMKNLSQDEVQKVNDNFQKWMKDGTVPPVVESKGDEMDLS